MRTLQSIRFGLSVDVLLGDRLFARFHVDVGFGDVEIMPLKKFCRSSSKGTEYSILKYAKLELPLKVRLPRSSQLGTTITSRASMSKKGGVTVHISLIKKTGTYG